MSVEFISPPDFDLNGEPPPSTNLFVVPADDSGNMSNSDTIPKGRKYKYTDPVNWYNCNKSSHAKELLQKSYWIQLSVDKDNTENWRAPLDEGISAKFGDDKLFYVISDNAVPFSNKTYYAPFQILVLLGFKANYYAAISWVSINFLQEKSPYLRVGVDYFKLIHKTDRFGIEGTELKKWKKEEIKEDHGRQHLTHIPKFDNFCIVPDNFSYKAVIGNCYNLYHPFRHTEAASDCPWSRILMEHIFGEQISVGYRYMQCLYLHPDKMAPILVLVSRERQTGKTTFLNWLNMIFGDNMVVINPEDLVSGFNSSYATSNIIAIEETLIEKSVTVEKLKSLATGKFISINEKFISPYKVPFHGKIIMSSNNEDKFARIDEEEIRFLIRKIGFPKQSNHQIEDILVKEIPAFLHHLSSLPPVDFSIGRVPFTIEELKNDSLIAVKKESKSTLYKDLVEHFIELFENEVGSESFVYANPVEIKRKWFEFNSQIGAAYIRSVIKSEFNLLPCEHMRYIPFASPGSMSKTGTPYKFTRKQFLEQDKQLLST